jgi:hypothetical protein
VEADKAETASESVKDALLEKLRENIKRAETARRALGAEPPRPKPENKYFGSRGRAGADPAAVQRYDAEVKRHREWMAANKKAREAEALAQEALRIAERQVSSEQEPGASMGRFTSKMPTQQATQAMFDLAKVIEAPSSSRLSASKFYLSHGHLVERVISLGGTVSFGSNGQRSLTPSNEAAVIGVKSEKQLSPVAMDFAEFLLKEKGYVREGNRYVPPSKPKAAPRAAEMETASESDKAIFEDVDANKNKKGAKSRIKQAYGARGTKAIFIEDNINQILQEAEENGKVTKICPD